LDPVGEGVEQSGAKLFAMPHVLIALLIVALVWILATTLGLPYLVALLVTVLAAVYLFGPGGRVIGDAPRRSR
jgi:ABC-type xylose transport system permease subunit